MLPPDAALLPSAPAFVETDLYCVRCGYNLRTLAIESICPECTHPVRDSFLIPADLRWLHHIRRGLTVLCIAGLLSIVANLVRMLIPFMGVNVALSILRLSSYSAAACSVIGAFLATRAPRHSPLTHLCSLGWVVRCLVLCTPALMLAELTLPFLTTYQFGFWVSFIWGLVHFCSTFALFGYLLLLLASLRIRLLGWWIAVVALSAISLVASQVYIYYIYTYLIPGGPAAPASSLFRIVGFAATLTHFGSTLGFALFAWICRSRVSRLIARSTES